MRDKIVILTRERHNELKKSQNKANIDLIINAFNTCEELLKMRLQVEEFKSNFSVPYEARDKYRYGEFLCHTLLEDLQKIKEKFIGDME